MTDSVPPLEPLPGDWPTYEDKIYAIFMETIVNGGLIFRRLPVKSQYRPETNGKGFSFWHLISEGQVEEDRTPDMRRCERIRWFAWLIKHAEERQEISWWENRRGTNTHVVIWLEVEQFAVVLAKRKNYYLIKTA